MSNNVWIFQLVIYGLNVRFFNTNAVELQTWMNWKLKAISETFLNSFKGQDIKLEFIDIVNENVHAGFLAIVIWGNTNKKSREN